MNIIKRFSEKHELKKIKMLLFFQNQYQMKEATTIYEKNISIYFPLHTLHLTFLFNVLRFIENKLKNKAIRSLSS